MEETIHIYYTNDLHSHFGYWPQVVGFLKEKQAENNIAGKTSWRVDIGDHVDRVHPVAEAFMGKANVQLLNEAGYDVVTLGNNEGITVSHDDLHDLYADANFSVVCANLSSTRQLSPSWLQTTVQKQSIHGVKVGFIGLTAPFNDYYELLDWYVAPPYETLDTQIHQLKQSCDIIVLLSHLGINDDQEIARRYPDIDVIIGGHTHHLLRTGETINETILTAAGKHCRFVGEVILTWDHETKQLVNKEAYTTDITHMAKDMQTANTLHLLEDDAHRKLSVTVGYVSTPLTARWFRHTDLMQKLTDTMLLWTKADCAMLNAGLIVDDLPGGAITYGDIHRVCPHPINPCVVELTGAELLEVVRVSLTKEFMEIKLKGFGFRGEVIGRMIFSGIDVVTDVRDDGEEVVQGVTMNGHPLERDTVYRLATADTFTFGRLLPEIAKSEYKAFFLPEFLRDLLVKSIQDDQ
ncbi:bifunctional metallophosphatase/5'-nucleotidase [Lentibacillus saliphilus]|uniref:bifunctional metallophosphatase/5'-nucleotidase n=1 Tax=Lentibacillus saliphilus TaxID=2737028 RepID=UPI001C2FE615|nr:bifunctional UDP-sugar hydrolase/5'-nucleotidase [Lentibacillus saliphilus]